MILQALNDYYARKGSDTEGGLAPEGFEVKAIPFVLVLAPDGRLVQLASRWEGQGKKRVAKAELVPQGAKKSVNVVSNLLWGNAEYVLGLPDAKKLAEKRAKGKEGDYLLRLSKMRSAFATKIQSLGPIALDDPGVRAVLAFLDSCQKALPEELTFDPAWGEVIAGNPLLSFQLITDAELVCQRPAVLEALGARVGGEPDGLCLISGEADVIERSHPAINGVWGAQTSGANIVAVNNKITGNSNGGQTPAFASYGKQQGYNAPVGKRAAFAYTTALNHLLAKGSRQRVQVGDASTVFWAEKASGAAFEEAVLDFINPPKEDDPDAGSQAVASLYRCVKDGQPFTDDDSQRFHVLGLAPNAARIAVRFWHVATIAELGRAFYRYFDELDIERPAYDAGKPLTLFRLLASTALLGKAENIPPNLGGDLMRAILAGGRYPETLMQGALRRIRAERDVNWVRAALLKAYLIRNLKKEITVSLNEESTDPGYRLGRLFAVLERVQERAQGNLNATIRERYYGAFSSTPVTVLPLLMKLKNHHLAKLPNRGEAVNLEKLLARVLDGLGTVPPRLALAQQAAFAIGYYHQRQAFFNKADADTNTPDQPAA